MIQDTPKRKGGRPRKQPLLAVQQGYAAVDDPPADTRPPRDTGIPIRAHGEWDSSTFLKQRVEELTHELRQAQERVQTLETALAGVVIHDGVTRTRDGYKAARAIAADALDYVRPHAQGDLWRRWVAQWPWLAENESKADGGEAAPADDDRAAGTDRP